MQVLWTKKAENNLNKIFDHTIKNFSFESAEKIYHEIKVTVSKLSEFPNLGRRVGGHEEKRQLIISGNSIVYEIFLGKISYIVIRNVRPRRTHQI